MARVKYIKTKNNEIIVFSELQQHKEFRHFEPVSAGFISFGIGKDRNPDCSCYGESVSLDLKSDEEVDTRLAKRQILGYDWE
jgi:hypothetical protein